MKLTVSLAVAAMGANADLLGLWDKALEKVPQSRNVMELFSLTNLFNYGCWCYFGDNKPVRGASQDTVDEMCKTWYDGKECIVIDDANCSVAAQDQYNDILTELDFPFDPTHDYLTLCDNANSDSACSSVNCAVDAFFLRSIFNHMAFNNLNNSMSRDFGFDAAVCHGAGARGLELGTTGSPFTTETPDPAATTEPADMGTTGEPEPLKACCGAHQPAPNGRFPYKVKSGTRSCCLDPDTQQGKSYSNGLYDCCVGGELEPVGGCVAGTQAP